MLVTEEDPLHRKEADHVTTATSNLPLLRKIGLYQQGVHPTNHPKVFQRRHLLHTLRMCEAEVSNNVLGFKTGPA